MRFIVQADVYFKGVNVAYGYALAGGMQQFGIVGEPVLNGDEGCYLIPVAPHTGYAEAALVEPWTCVVASYRIKPRKALKPGGVTLIVAVDERDYEIDPAICADGAPGKLILAGAGGALTSRICNCEGCRAQVVETGKLSANDVKPLAQERTGGAGFDDVIVLGTPEPDLVEALDKCLAKNAVVAIAGDKPMSRSVSIDVGRVHYDAIDYTGTASRQVSDAYSGSRDSEMKPGGSAWLVGAAGPMGQMHVRRAALMKNGPRKILCTDVDNTRLDYLKAGVAGHAAANGIEIAFLNPLEAGTDALKKVIREITLGKGFDDIVVLAPIPALITGSVEHLAVGGLMNIFAGVPRGTFADIDLSAVYLKGNRFVGSSGSRPKDMVDTLGLTESGDLPTRDSMAAVGGIDAMADGVMAVKHAKFPGKTVIFPHIHMPLTALTDLNDSMPSVYAKLRDGKFWTREAEEELLKNKLES